jgi:hypothetical protein
VSHTVDGTPALLAGHPEFGALLRETRGKTVTVWQLDASGEELTALAEHEPGFHLTGHLGADGTAWWVADDDLYRDGELHGPVPRGGDWTVGSLDDQLWLAYLDGGDLVLADSSGQASRTIGLSLASSAVGVVVGPRLSWVFFDGFPTREPTADDLPETRVAAIGPFGQVGLPTVVRRAAPDARPGMAATRLEDGRLLVVFADGGVRVFAP